MEVILGCITIPAIVLPILGVLIHKRILWQRHRHILLSMVWSMAGVCLFTVGIQGALKIDAYRNAQAYEGNVAFFRALPAPEGMESSYWADKLESGVLFASTQTTDNFTPVAEFLQWLGARETDYAVIAQLKRSGYEAHLHKLADAHRSKSRLRTVNSKGERVFRLLWVEDLIDRAFAD